MQYEKSNYIKIAVDASGAVILNQRKEILLVQEKKENIAGLWNIPSGRVENGESLLYALHREINEETGLKLSYVEYLNTYLGTLLDGSVIARHVWITRYDEKQQIQSRFKNEIIDCQFVSNDKFQKMFEEGIIRMYHLKHIFQDALNYKFLN